MNRFLVLATLCLGIYGASYNDEGKCNENAIFKRCANPCPKTCEQDILRDNDGSGCDRSRCKPGCDCTKGFILNNAGDCISIDDCKNSCKPHSHYNDESCSASCKHLFDGEPCEPETENCECDEGYFLNSNGDCVAIFDCQPEEVNCPANQTFFTCASSCPVSCGNMYLQEPCDRKCNIKCDCLPGYVFNEAGVCIIASECREEEIKCPTNKVYKPCGNADSRTCEDLYSPLECHSDCLPGCYCPDGLVFSAEQNLCIQPFECPDSLENQACRNVDPNMQYNNCHIGKARTCSRPEEVLEGDCNSGCYCKPGMVLNRDHKCVSLDDCKWKKGDGKY